MTVVFEPGRTRPRTSTTSAGPVCTTWGRSRPATAPTRSPYPRPTGNRSTTPGSPASPRSTPTAIVYDQHRRVVLAHSQHLHEDQARSFTGTTLAKVGRQLDDLAATLVRGKTRRTHEQLATEIEKVTHSPWVHAVIDWELTIGEIAKDRQLSWAVNDIKRETLENNVFGKRILITDHDWPVSNVVAGYRSQSEIEFGFRQLKDPHEVSFSPMYHPGSRSAPAPAGRGWNPRLSCRPAYERPIRPGGPCQ